MPVLSDVVGLELARTRAEVDARWLMAFAAGLGEVSPCYLDTCRPGGIVSHPLFPACVEWPAIQIANAPRSLTGLTEDEYRRGIHVSHDCVLHRLVRPGDHLVTVATATGARMHRRGALQTLVLHTSAADGQVVSVTRQEGLFLDVPLLGNERFAPSAFDEYGEMERDSPEPCGAHARTTAVVVSASAPHVYSECSRIWNPIHTDPEAAKRAGLPSIILHGSATLALAVSRLVELEAGGDPRAVRRVAARFRAMVQVPQQLELRSWRVEPRLAEQCVVRFELSTEDGAPALSEGRMIIADWSR